MNRIIDKISRLHSRPWLFHPAEILGELLGTDNLVLTEDGNRVIGIERSVPGGTELPESLQISKDVVKTIDRPGEGHIKVKQTEEGISILCLSEFVFDELTEDVYPSTKIRKLPRISLSEYLNGKTKRTFPK